MVLPARQKHTLLSMEDVDEEDLKWLWWPYIPIGCASLIFGPGGVGKSHIIVDFAARVTTGRPFPMEKSTKRKPGNVLILSAEDDPGQVIKPRLRNAGADMKRVFTPDEEFILDKAGLRELEGFMAQCSATVVFIDPVVAFMGGKTDMFRANEVRALMAPLNKAAQRTGTALVAVGHERKNKAGSMQDNAMGSADFVNAARSTLYVVEDKKGKAMWHVKSNYAKKGAALEFSFDEDKDAIVWGDIREGEPDFCSTYQAQGGGGYSGEGSGRKSQAISFLKTLLKDGPVPSTEVEMAADDEEINSRTLDRAKKEMGVKSFSKHVDGKLTWFWKLPSSEGEK